MDLLAQVDGYCERVDFTYWSEPVNAITNLAFILCAIIMARRTGGDVVSGVLCAVVFCIGVGSYLFHTHATIWAALSDTIPIGMFILIYLFGINWQVIGLRWWIAVLITLLFIPYAAAMVPMINAAPFLHISGFYWTVPLLLVIYAIGLRRRHRQTAQGLAIGAVILSVSIVLRSLDEILCPVWPYGTHFAWHCLNAVMLGYMIHVYHAHVLAARAAER